MAEAPRPSRTAPREVERDISGDNDSDGAALSISGHRGRASGGGGNAAGEALQQETREQWPPPGSPPALTGELAEITKLIKSNKVDDALAKARDWHVKEPGNVLALIALGDSLEAKGSSVTAARVYGSIIDLFPGRADMRRFAG